MAGDSDFHQWTKTFNTQHFNYSLAVLCITWWRVVEMSCMKNFVHWWKSKTTPTLPLIAWWMTFSECWGWRKKWFCYAQTNSNVWFSWCLWDFVIAKQTKYVILNGQLSCIDMVQDSPWSNRVLQALLTWNSSTQLNSLSLLLGRGPRLRSRPSAPLSHTANGTDWPAYELRCCFPTVVSSLRVSTWGCGIGRKGC